MSYFRFKFQSKVGVGKKKRRRYVGCCEILMRPVRRNLYDIDIDIYLG